MAQKRFICTTTLVLIAVLIAVFTFAFTPNTRIADAEDQIKVGYYIQEGLQMIDSQTNKKSGLGYEYLQKVAQYGGFSYQYVEGTYEELCDKLTSGEIDIMIYRLEDYYAPNVYTLGDRVMLEDYCLFKNKSNFKIDVDAISDFIYESLDGTTIGIMQGANEIIFINSYVSTIEMMCDYYGDPVPTIEIKNYTDENELEKDFAEGKIDMVLNKIAYSKENKLATMVSNIGSYQFFICTQGDEYGSYAINDELATLITNANNRFVSTEPSYADALYRKYFGYADNRLELSENELTY